MLFLFLFLLGEEFISFYFGGEQGGRRKMFFLSKALFYCDLFFFSLKVPATAHQRSSPLIQL